MIDPICDMDIDPEDAAGKAEYQGRLYYFCNPMCLERFQAEPAKYVDSEGPRQRDSRQG